MHVCVVNVGNYHDVSQIVTFQVNENRTMTFVERLVIGDKTTITHCSLLITIGLFMLSLVSITINDKLRRQGWVFETLLNLVN